MTGTTGAPRAWSTKSTSPWTSSIMDAHEDCLRCLACVFGWNARMSGLKDDLVLMRRECDYWRKRAEEAE